MDQKSFCYMRLEKHERVRSNTTSFLEIWKFILKNVQSIYIKESTTLAFAYELIWEYLSP